MKQSGHRPLILITERRGRSAAGCNELRAAALTAGDQIALAPGALPGGKPGPGRRVQRAAEKLQKHLEGCRKIAGSMPGQDAQALAEGGRR